MMLTYQQNMHSEKKYVVRKICLHLDYHTQSFHHKILDDINNMLARLDPQACPIRRLDGPIQAELILQLIKRLNSLNSLINT